VVIFAVDGTSDPRPPEPSQTGGWEVASLARSAVLDLLDSRLAAPVFAAALIVVLVLGMLLKR